MRIYRYDLCILFDMMLFTEFRPSLIYIQALGRFFILTFPCLFIRIFQTLLQESRIHLLHGLVELATLLISQYLTNLVISIFLLMIDDVQYLFKLIHNLHSFLRVKNINCEQTTFCRISTD